MLDDGEHCIGAASARCLTNLGHLLPTEQELGERHPGHRLCLMTQPRDTSPPDPAEHLRLAPLVALATGAELPTDDPTAGGEALHGKFCDRRCQPEGLGEVGCLEGAVGAGKAMDEITNRVGDRLAELDRHPWRQDDAEGVAKARGVLDRSRDSAARSTGPAHADSSTR